jgi:F-type H+-transporting ATPase subunit b
LAQARKEREQMLREAKDLHARLVQQAEEEGKKIKERKLQEALQEIESAKQNALQEIKQTVADISIEIAEKLLRSELSDPNKQQQYIEKLLKESNLN